MAAEAEAAPTAGGAATTTVAAATFEEVKPYKIHVSSKYLDLTKQKLEITRLPHETPEPKSRDWWEPKPQVEPLIDYWLEQYSWRDQETILNQLPQFRTGFEIPPSESPIRAHFVHVASAHPNAIPLLLIPSFPFSNLSFGHLVKPLTDPDDAAATQPFHLVIPALPGLGFSDALPNNTPLISTTGEMLNLLMHRLSYPHYLVSNTGSGAVSPAEIDFKIANYLATEHPDSCLGTHFVAPPLLQPRLQEAPVEWAKWSIANLFQAPILGYEAEDFSALERTGYVKPRRKAPTPHQFGLDRFGLSEPNTLAYALCDSPTGLLVFALKTLQLLNPKRVYTPTEIINFTQLAWLPGPEGAMRFWAYCMEHPEPTEKKPAAAEEVTGFWARYRQSLETPEKKRRPRIAITVFLGDVPEDTETVDDEEIELETQTPTGLQLLEKYACPSWGNGSYEILHTHRAAGKSGMLAWERPELIASGIRGLATELLRIDPRIRPSEAGTTAPLEQVVSGSGTTPGAGEPTPSPPPAPVEPMDLRPPEPPFIKSARIQPIREESEETRVASTSSPAIPSPDPGVKQLELGKPEGQATPQGETSDDTRVASPASAASAASPAAAGPAAKQDDELLKPIERIKPHREASDDTRVESQADERSKSTSPALPVSPEPVPNEDPFNAVNEEEKEEPKTKQKAGLKEEPEAELATGPPSALPEEKAEQVAAAVKGEGVKREPPMTDERRDLSDVTLAETSPIVPAVDPAVPAGRA